MKKNLKTVFEFVLVACIVALSVAVFLNRDLLREQFDSARPVGYLGLFVLCFLANSTVLLPAPSLLLAASFAAIMNPWLVAVVASAGSACGELVGYLFGRTGSDLSPAFQTLMEKIRARNIRPLLLVFLLALLPLPLFDLIGIYSGGTRIHPLKFLAACFLGKFLKMLFYIQCYDIVIAWALNTLKDLGILNALPEGLPWQ